MESKLTIHCKTCRSILARSDVCAFYEQPSKGVHLIVKPEARNSILDDIKVEQDKSEKKNKFVQAILNCNGCSNKIGSESFVGPKSEAVFCLKMESIYFLKIINNQEKQFDFDRKAKWSTEKSKFPEIEHKDVISFYATSKTSNKVGTIKAETIEIPKLKINFPSVNDVMRFDIGPLIADEPRTYQIELYVAALCMNTIVYMPTGAGKTMIAAMCATFMKKTNPNKKIFFVCDRIPLVFQQGAYLRAQTGLSVGEFCGECRQIAKSQLNCDILVFTCDFLINILTNKTLSMDDCCCLIIDEIHHAHEGHSFNKLIENFCDKLSDELRPRIIGLTASPSGHVKPTREKMLDEIQRLCKLIRGQIYMPIKYRNEFDQVVYRPQMEFYTTNDFDFSENQFVEIINMFAQPYLKYLNSIIKVKFEIKYENILKNFLNNKLYEANISKNQKSYIVTNFLLKLLNAFEILYILGLTSATKFLKECIDKEIEDYNNKTKAKVWSTDDIHNIKQLKKDIEMFKGESSKIEKLRSLLKSSNFDVNNNNSDASRIIVFARRRKTARYLCDYLRNDEIIKKQWNPQLFIGHGDGQLDGMNWFDEQKPTLKRFHAGKSRLIVSTNVLQEGLDVDSCDKIIIFDRLTSITEYIQSRGRARYKTSRFIMIGSYQEKEFYEKLIESEAILIDLVRNLVQNNSYFGYELDPLIKLILSDVNCEFRLSKKRSNEIFNYKFKANNENSFLKYTLQIYLYKKSDEYMETNESSNKFSLIIKELFYRLKSIKYYSQADICDKTFLSNELIIDQHRIYNCLFKLPIYLDDSDVSSKSIENIFGIIKYILSINSEKEKAQNNYLNNFNCAIILLEKVKLKLDELPYKQLICTNIQFGNFLTPFEFLMDYNNQLNIDKSVDTNENVKMIVKFNERLIILMFFIGKCLYKIEFDFNSIDTIMCIDENDNNSYIYAYIPCKQAPFVYIIDNDIVENNENETKPAKIPKPNSNDTAITIANLRNLDEEHIDWKRTVFEDKKLDWSLKIEIKVNEKLNLIQSFKAIRPNQVIFTNIKTSSITYTMNDLRSNFNHIKNESIYYLFECLLTQYDSMLNGRLTSNFLNMINTLNVKQLEYLFEKLILRLESNRFTCVDKLSKTILDEMSKINILNYVNDEELKVILPNKSSENSTDRKLYLIKRAIITPTRVIYYQPELNVANRVLRKFGSDNFLRVRIRDEDLRKLNMSKNFTDMQLIYEKLNNTFVQGIRLSNRRYEFLAMSASQLRDHGCWLYATSQSSPNITTNAIRDWMGDFKNIRCIGKYAARLGQSLSSSIECFETSFVNTIQDIEVLHKENKYCFTDGIGKISKLKASEICKKYYNSKYISAFQIRFAGFKGVVAVDPKLDEANELVFRPSMKKFESSNKGLDVLNIADYIPCYLNRQVIIILSALGIPDRVFIDLHDLMIKRLNQILINNSIAAMYILQCYKPSFTFNICNENSAFTELDYTQEPFFREILKAIHYKQFGDLITKSRIFIEKGRILMGVIDEYNVLEENEVFIQCNIETPYISQERFEFYPEIIKSDFNGNEYFVVKSKVAVAKNPCMHPGDVRVLNAVYKKDLSHLTNCIVFPAKGQRPITNMCSGSDLDGDLYFVTWEPLLIPEQCEKPMEYNSPQTKEKSSDIIIEDVIKFFIDFIQNDQLGRIANAHVALSDMKPLGCKDELCKQLALAFSLAVDFPKTGITVQLPSTIKIENYPDFMGKHSCISYESQKVIGVMYRKCNELTSSYSNYFFNETIKLNPCFVLPNHDKYLDDALTMYRNYRAEIERLLVYFDFKYECELFVGSYLNQDRLYDDSKNTCKLAVTTLSKLWYHMREEFFREFADDREISQKVKTIDYSNENIYLKASAWYVACYSNELNYKTNLKVLSFPWILEDVFMKFKKFRNYDQFSQSIVTKYLKNLHKYQLISRYMNNISYKDKLSNDIQLNLFFYGACGLFLFENSQDIDLIVYKDVNTVVQWVNMLQNQHESTLEDSSNSIELTPIIDNTLKSKLEDDENLENVTIIGNTILCQTSLEFAFTITDSIDTLLRQIYIRETIFLNDYLLPLFHLIVHFIRLDNLFIQLQNDKITLDLFLLYVIDYLNSKRYLKTYLNDAKFFKNIEELLKNPDEANKWLQLHDNLEQLEIENKIDLRKMLLEFYHEHCYNMESLKFQVKFSAKVEELKLSEPVNKALKQHFFNALNFISKINDVASVWNLVFHLNKYEENYSQKFFVMRRYHPSRGKKNPNLKTQSLFVENSSKLLFSNYINDSYLIDFDIYNGLRRSMHWNKHCYSVNLLCNVPSSELFINRNFTVNCYNEYLMHFQKQFLKAKEINLDKNDYDFRFQIKFGNVYFINIPTMLIENKITLRKFYESLERSYKKNKLEFLKDVSLELGCNEKSEDNESNEDETEDLSLKTDDLDVKNEKEDSAGLAFNEHDDYDDDYDDVSVDISQFTKSSERNDEDKKKRRKKKKAKKPILHASSAFDSHISETYEPLLHKIFGDSEFDSQPSEGFIVYLELIDKQTNTIIAYRVKYDANMTLIRVETLPIKWLALDVRNTMENCKQLNSDIRFLLVSQKLIDISSVMSGEELMETDRLSRHDALLNEIKKGIIKRIDDTNDNKLIVNEYFREANVFVRHSKTIKYNGSFDNWKTIFQLAGINLENLPDYMQNSCFYNNINVSIFDLCEHAENDSNGIFTKVSTKRKELNIGIKLEMDKLKISECHELANITWWVSQAFNNIALDNRVNF